MGNRREKGFLYEDKVVEFLKKKKFKIIKKNYYSRFGEIDIIAKDKNILVFIEVKTRDKSTNYNPYEAVDKYKQQKIIKTAKKYLFENNLYKTFLRFDVVGVLTNGDKVEKIELIKDAFQTD